MKKVLFIVLTVLSVLLISCSKKEEQKVVEEQPVVETQPVVAEVEPVQETPVKKEAITDTYLKKVSHSSYTRKNDYENITESEIYANNFYAKAHSKYLNDELKFKELGDGDIKDGRTYLVRGIDCKFFLPEQFEEVHIEGDYYSTRYIIKDPEHFDGEEIPLGTILPMFLDKNGYPVSLRSGGEEWHEKVYGYFYYDEAYNIFYKTEWNGKEGYVYGAYIESNDSLANLFNSELYKTNGVLNEFYNYYGIYNSLGGTAVAEALEKDRLALQKLDYSHCSYDDLIDEYYVPDENSMFVTTDLAAHIQHRIFDNQLQRIEEEYFIPRLLTITGNFIKVLSEREDLPEDIKHKAIAYFQVPELILRSVPKKYIDPNDWSKTVQYNDINVDEIIPEYPEDVQADYRQVMEASGNKTAIFGTEEDFTQYKPRGHYTKNKALETYFRAQMWYGRIHFCIADERDNPYAPEETKVMQPIAMAVVDTVHKNPELYDQWKELFDPITELIGLSDDLGFEDVLPLWKAQNVEDFPAWVTDEEKLTEFRELCHQKLRPPAISGNSSWTGPSELGEDGEIKPPMGWRFLGQRFTYDSYVHQAVSAPRLMARDLIRGLDVMKAFGSNTAEILLAMDDYLEADTTPTYRGGNRLKERLDIKQNEFAQKDTAFWTQNYYNSILAQIKAEATFEQGAGFYFTETPMWNIKAMISSHSTWAELRHDTILYVKQVYAERAGGDDLEMTYKYVPLPKPINYIEPNLPFWEYSKSSIIALSNTLNNYGLLDAESDTVFGSLIELYKHAAEIVKLEIEDKPISDKDNEWIRKIPNQLKSLLIMNSGGYIGEDGWKMACIADVFTNAEFGVCLEVGVGKPYRIYVPLNDGQGGKRIAIGYIPSYYEFYHGMNDRMTDEQWKEIVYKKDVDMTEYEPFWEQGCYLPEN